MQDRIKKILEYSGLNQGLFAEKIAVAPATLSNILKGKTKPSLEIAQNLRQAFPELNTFWLLDGTGEMFREPDADQAASSAADSTAQGALDFSQDLFAPASAQAAQNVPSRLQGSGGNALSYSGTYDPRNASVYRKAEIPGNPGEIQMVKIVDKPTRKVKEIQVFYDDDTYEVFVPRK